MPGQPSVLDSFLLCWQVPYNGSGDSTALLSVVAVFCVEVCDYTKFSIAQPNRNCIIKRMAFVFQLSVDAVPFNPNSCYATNVFLPSKRNLHLAQMYIMFLSPTK